MAPGADMELSVLTDSTPTAVQAQEFARILETARSSLTFGLSQKFCVQLCPRCAESSAFVQRFQK